MASTFAALAREHGGSLNKQQVLDLVTSTGIGKGQDAEAADLLWGEMGLAENAHITEVSLSCHFMSDACQAPTASMFRCWLCLPGVAVRMCSLCQ